MTDDYHSLNYDGSGTDSRQNFRRDLAMGRLVRRAEEAEARVEDLEAKLAQAVDALAKENEWLKKQFDNCRKAIGAHAEPISGTPYLCGPRAWLQVFDSAILTGDKT